MAALNHRLINSPYDQDMKLCEDFVNAYLYPDNFAYQRIVHYYYMSRLEAYWNSAMEYLVSPAVIDNNNRLKGFPGLYHSLSSIEIKRIQNKIPQWQIEFSYYLEILDIDFHKTQRLDLVNINRLFKIIGDIMCLFRYTFNSDEKIMPVPTAEEIQNSDYDKFISRYEYVPNENLIAERNVSSKYASFVLPNDIGLFGLNTYLYCLFNRVFLLGIPLSIQSYDSLEACPGQFLFHDGFHTRVISGGDYMMYRSLYQTIMNDPTFSPLQRELYVLNLWTTVHELSGSNRPNIYDLSFMNYIVSLFKVPPLVSEFYNDYNRYNELTMSRDNLEFIIRQLRDSPEFLIDVDNICRSIAIEKHLEHPSRPFTMMDIINNIKNGARTDDILLDMIGLQIITQGTAWIHLHEIMKISI